MSDKKWTIWQNMDVDVDEWREDYQVCKELSDEEMEDVSDSDIYEWACDCNSMYLDDERINLDVNVGDEILVFGDIGRWNGQFSGYKVIKSGNIKDCLYDEDCVYCNWYCDEEDMRFDGVHHDGRNHYLYRTWADGVTEDDKEEFLDSVYVCGDISDEELKKYTKSLRPYVAEVYGW